MANTTAPRLPTDILTMLARIQTRGNPKRLEAVLAMSGEDGADLAELSARLGVPRKTLAYWRDTWKLEAGAALAPEGYAPPITEPARRTAGRRRAVA